MCVCVCVCVCVHSYHLQTILVVDVLKAAQSVSEEEIKLVTNKINELSLQNNKLSQVCLICYTSESELSACIYQVSIFS